MHMENFDLICMIKTIKNSLSISFYMIIYYYYYYIEYTHPIYFHNAELSFSAYFYDQGIPWDLNFVVFVF